MVLMSSVIGLLGLLIGRFVNVVINRNCQSPISRRYPVVELLTASLFFVTARLNLSMETHPARLLLNLVFVAMLVALSLIDLESFHLPDVLTLPLQGLDYWELFSYREIQAAGKVCFVLWGRHCYSGPSPDFIRKKWVLGMSSWLLPWVLF